ncbi:prolyl oligopeptidase family serine peptidase [Pacificimonas sp. ICDLI1SI03]
MKKKISIAAAATLTLLAAPGAAARPLSPEDLVALQRISDAAVSPDGSLAIFTLHTTDLDANRGRSDLFTLDLTGGDAAPARWNGHAENDGSPVFSPDGRQIYWLSGRSGSSQIWTAPIDGGEPNMVLSVEGGVGGFHLAPDGETLVYWTDVTPDSADSPGEGRVYDKLFVRHWDSWDRGARSQLFSVSTSGEGTPVALTAQMDGDVPTKPFGGPDDVAISADGASVYFVLREKGTSEPWSTNLDIWNVPTDGSAAPVNLTADNAGTDTAPSLSPDGRYMAYASMARATYEADQLVLKVRDLATGEVDAFPDLLPNGVGHIEWAPDSRSMLITTADGWNDALFRITPDGTSERLPVPGGSYSVLSVTEQGALVNRNSLTEPGDLYWRTDQGERRLTSINADLLADIDMGEISRFSFAGAEGDEVFGYVVRPPDLAEGATAPTVLWSHGGPQGHWTNAWSSRWNPQAWAGAGYAIITVDFHGSSGYGQDFTDSINNDWGGKPLQDLQLGLAAARDQFDFIDDEQACAAGASYGGYMMNWIEGAWPDEFACLVNHAGLFDMRSFYYSTEELWFPEWDFGGPYFERVEAFERWNPATRVTDWKTPMLVIQGLRDYRVPYTQSLMAFTALQRQGIDSRLLVFDDENHWILSPANSLQWHSEVFRWLDEYLKK